MVSQLISESYAIDTEYGIILRIFGYIPSGILITLFCFLGVKYFQPSILIKIGFYGIGIFYGLATLVVGIFPCDSGCNKALIDPSFSQLIHNFTGLLTYLFVPFLMILLGIVSFLLLCVISSDLTSEYIGLYQRMIELVFVFWIIFCANEIKSKNGYTF